MRVILHAAAVGRNYITPEDVSAALADGQEPDLVRLEVLDAIAKLSAEDVSGCASVAWRAT